MTTKAKAIIAAAAGGIVLLALLGGGPPSELEVKGLRLGMSVEEAARVMLGHGFELGDMSAFGSINGAPREYTEVEKALLWPHVFRGDGWGLKVGREGKLDAIELSAAAIGKLFGAGDMSAEEFAASFASAYGVPLEPTAEVVDPDIAMFTGEFLKTGWAFVDRDAGWAVNISDAKVLEIRAITQASKQSFD